MLKITKDIEIPINRAEALEYHYELYTLLKSIYMISHIPLALAAHLFVEIYIDIIEYKPFSTNGHKYIVHLLDCYSNYQWIFFAKTKETIFEKFVEVVTFLENQTSLKVQMIYLNNSTKFYLIELITFASRKGIHLKLIILGVSS